MAWAETQISDFENPELQKEGALESPRKQNSELQISDSQLGGSTSKVEYRFTDFRFRCARSARGQGVYISFSDFGVFALIKNTSQNGTL